MHGFMMFFVNIYIYIYKYNAYVIQKASVDVYIPMKRKNI